MPKRGKCAICDGIVIDSGGDLDTAGKQAYTRWEGYQKSGLFYHFDCADQEKQKGGGTDGQAARQ